MKTTLVVLGFSLSVIMLLNLSSDSRTPIKRVIIPGRMNIPVADKTLISMHKPVKWSLLNNIQKPAHPVIVQGNSIAPYGIGNLHNEIKLPIRYKLAILPPKIRINKPFKKEYIPILT